VVAKKKLKSNYMNGNLFEMSREQIEAMKEKLIHEIEKKIGDLVSEAQINGYDIKYRMHFSNEEMNITIDYSDNTPDEFRERIAKAVQS
jgi:cytochrome c-type biogenesis protein CcmE